MRKCQQFPLDFYNDIIIITDTNTVVVKWQLWSFDIDDRFEVSIILRWDCALWKIAQKFGIKIVFSITIVNTYLVLIKISMLQRLKIPTILFVCYVMEFQI